MSSFLAAELFQTIIIQRGSTVVLLILKIQLYEPCTVLVRG